MLPQKINFICVGTQKAGTTTLFEILKQHPDIFLPDEKEVHFFDRDYEKGLKFVFNKYYFNYSGEKIVGDITPSYMYFENVPYRIKETFGTDIKLLFILRNPADRAFSHYLMSYRRGLEKLDFWEAIEIEPKRLKTYFNKLHFSYIDRGFYAKQIKRFLEIFPKKNIKILIFEEDFVKLENRKKTIEEILKFLNIDVIQLNVDIKSNEKKLPRNKIIQTLLSYSLYSENILRKSFRNVLKSEKLRSEIRKLLKKLEEKNLKYANDVKLSNEEKKYLIYKYFIEDIKNLEKILGRDLFIWYKNL